MLGIQSGIEGLRSANIINQSTKSITRSIQHITSGSQINRAADDPTGLAVSEKLRNRAAGIQQASRNVQNDSAFLGIADGALSNTANILNRLKELAVKGTDATLSTTERNTMSMEAQALLNQIDVNGATKYGSNSVFSSSAFTAFIGVDSSFKVSFTLGALGASSLGISGITGMFGTSALASSASGLITTALDNLTNMQAQVGTWQSTLGYIQDGLDTEATNLLEADATLRDTDMAREMTNYVKETIRLQASQFMTAQSNQSAYSVLNLLQ